MTIKSIMPRNYKNIFCSSMHLLPNCLLTRLQSLRKLQSSPMNSAMTFPYFTSGKVIKGFGRGSKDLGFPTANFSEDVTDALPESFPCGIYYGWAKVGDGPVDKMVMSIGYNPFYNNVKKTMETHIMSSFKRDFYGSVLKVCLLGYLREEKNFEYIEQLVDEIKNDIKVATELLDDSKLASYQRHEFFEL